MGKIFIVRHCNPAYLNNKNDSYAGLTSVGIHQARELAKKLYDYSHEWTVHSSHLPRAVLTAAPLIALVGCTPSITPVLQELNHAGSVKDFYNRALDNPDFKFLDGESCKEAYSRVKTYLDNITGNTNICVFTHGTIITLLINQGTYSKDVFIDISFPDIFNYDNGKITRAPEFLPKNITHHMLRTKNE
jgi:broad specificity phosphatase PhoE